MQRIKFCTVEGADPELFMMIVDEAARRELADRFAIPYGPMTEAEFRAVLRAGGVPDTYVTELVAIARKNRIARP